MATSIAAKHSYRFGYLKSEHWSNLRLSKLARVDATCEICGHRDLSNDVHHHRYSQSVYEVSEDDLVVLCRSCHDAVHSYLEQTTLPKGEIRRDDFDKIRKRVKVREWRRRTAVRLFHGRVSELQAFIDFAKRELAEAYSSLKQKNGGRMPFRPGVWKDELVEWRYSMPRRPTDEEWDEAARAIDTRPCVSRSEGNCAVVQ